MAGTERNVDVEERDKTWEHSQSQAVDVKSKVMVKSARRLPIYQFSRLDQNTDLHRPPDNWLRSDAKLSNTWVTGECTQFSSFAMAETLPDTVGEVDVISAAENIKKLLKIPFSKTQVSMAVHRVGKTLLLDELDLYKHLRSASQGEREWMKTFLIQAVLSEGKSLTMKRKTNELLQNWNLLSKFLYYSIGNSSDESVPQQTYDFEEQHLPPNQSALIQIPDLLPKTKPSEFARQALWQFEDIRMLIGTDLPIFGEGIHPAVSLRLKDMSSPINVLTGLDYWLDNLMSNVPELAMCYHLNGIVQKYELLKTEEIPNLEDANFAPQVVKDVAQNVLSFLKSHCTKEGHTYWLFKGEDEDVVKLYDLTSLCNEYPNRPWENPFISPVAILLYRVARNLSMSGPNKKDKSTIYKLLKNCLQLLEGREGSHPEVAASACHLLSHVFINEDDLTDSPPPAFSSSASQKPSKKTPQQADSSSGDDEEEFVIEEEDGEASLTVPTMDTQSLMLPSGKHGVFKERRRRRRSAKTVYASKEEKAKKAFTYIVMGLKSIIECPKSTEAPSQEQAAKLPSPLPSPTRVRTLCYPSSSVAGESRGKTDRADAELRQLPEGTGEDQRQSEQEASYTTNKKCDSRAEAKQLGAEKKESSKSDLNLSDQVKEVGIACSTESRDSGETKSATEVSDLEIVVSSSSVMPVAPFPGTADNSGQDLEIRDSAKPKQPNVSKLETSGPSVHEGIQLRDQSDDSNESSGSSDTSSCLPEDTKPSTGEEEPLPLTDLSIATRTWHPGSWQHEMNFLLLKKACEAYLVLAKIARDSEKYGRALHLAHMSLLCQSACQSMDVVNLPDTNSAPNLLGDQLAVCGDCLTLLTHNLASYLRQREDFKYLTADDQFILRVVQQHHPTNEYEWAVDFRNDTEHNLKTSIQCYMLALSESSDRGDDYVTALTRKQGNAHNELGVYYMNQALVLRNNEGSLQSEQDLWRKSLRCFESGIEIFESVKDGANIALLLCNMGKLMRLCAFSFGESEFCSGSEMSQQERSYYYKAIDYYQRALRQLGQRKKNPYLWESVTWELSSTYFAMATILQDHPPLSSMAQEQVEKDIIGLMNNALHLCEVEDITPAKQPVYQYRAATIHHRLASMHHNAYRNQSSLQKQKHTRSLAELHYQKAVRLFQDLDRPSELLRVLLERVALLEHQFEGQSGISARIKTLHAGLEALLQCKDALSALHKARTKEATQSDVPAGATRNVDGVDSDVVDRCPNPQELDVEEGDSSGLSGDSEGGSVEILDSKGVLLETSLPNSRTRNQGLQSEVGKGSSDEEKKQQEKLHDDSKQDLGAHKPAQVSSKKRYGVTGQGSHAEGLGSKVKARLSEGEEEQQRKLQVDSTEEAGSHKPAQVSSKTRAGIGGQGAHAEGQSSKVKDRLSKEEEEEQLRLETMWESRLQYMLRNLVKLHSANKKGMQQIADYKKMYAASLGRTRPSSSSPSSLSSCSSSSSLTPESTKTLVSILDEVQQLFQGVK
ncbi:erythroid differentiation-related factor 1-like [Patiria miniata]|uniref:Erythroid differentiation-related factor 1 n=1 Tax=Patiria miniata TaxID=46514 RepID=A0A914B2Q1_PATMI|nr:erythroid differentiation-related factor 1-like [Patiria miniata]XP_038070616.1 erythroid differentiation-related factor 1-like [Patiria miniata]